MGGATAFKVNVNHLLSDTNEQAFVSQSKSLWFLKRESMIENMHSGKPKLVHQVFSVCKYVSVYVCSVRFLSGCQSHQAGCVEAAGSEVNSMLWSCVCYCYAALGRVNIAHTASAGLCTSCLPLSLSQTHTHTQTAQPPVLWEPSVGHFHVLMGPEWTNLNWWNIIPLRGGQELSWPPLLLSLSSNVQEKMGRFSYACYCGWIEYFTLSHSLNVHLRYFLEKTVWIQKPATLFSLSTGFS